MAATCHRKPPQNVLNNRSIPILRPQIRTFLVSWLPVFAWMAIIFSASSDSMSADHTSRFVGPFVRWLRPQISEENLERIHAAIRKAGHLAEYAILSALIIRARRKSRPDGDKSWNWRDAGISLLISATYAASDEFHQIFVLSRQASVVDVAIDTTGAGIALLLVWEIGRRLRHW